MTTGVIFVHSAPRALAPHIEWAVRGVLGVPSRWTWDEQPASPRHVRAELAWRGGDNTGAELMSTLRGMPELRFEVTQDPSPLADGARWTCTPDLGVHYAQMDRAGNVVLTEEQVRGCLERAGNNPVAISRELGIAMGEPWDEELELYRYAAEGEPMRWLYRVS